MEGIGEMWLAVDWVWGGACMGLGDMEHCFLQVGNGCRWENRSVGDCDVVGQDAMCSMEGSMRVSGGGEMKVYEMYVVNVCVWNGAEVH